MLGRRRKRRHKEKLPKGLFFGQMLVGIGLCLFFVLLGAIVWYGTRLEALTITEVSVVGGETVKHDSVRSVAEEQLKGNYYRVIPRRFAWSYPEEDIVSKIKELPRVKDVSVVRQEHNQILVSFSEYRPFALWCAGGEEMLVTDTCTFIDDQGYSFVSSPPLSGTSFLRFKNGNSPKVGDKPFSAEFLSETSKIVSELSRRFNFDVIAIERIGLDEVSFHLVGGSVLKATMRQSAEDTVDNLEVILASNEFAHLTTGNFEYIDLRFGDKVFVNEDGDLKDEEAIATSTATSTADGL